jgi:hypothetical protein
VWGARWKDEYGTPQRLQPFAGVSRSDSCTDHAQGLCRSWRLVSLQPGTGFFWGCDDSKEAETRSIPNAASKPGRKKQNVQISLDDNRESVVRRL